MTRSVRFINCAAALIAAILLLVSCSDHPSGRPVIIRQDMPPFDEMPQTSALPGDGSRNPFISGKPKLRGVWISYLELEPMLRGKSKAEFQRNFDSAMAFVSDSGLNTVFVQVRPFADALYPSEYFPFSRFVTGVRGDKLPFDPLAVMLRSAEARHLAFHAWINPYRVASSAGQKPQKDDLIAGRKDVLPWKGGLYLDPSSADARRLICDGISELLTRYRDIRGIHFDDYF